MDEKKLLDTASGICPLGPSKKVRAAIRKAVRHIGTSYDRNSHLLNKFFSSKFGSPANAFVFASSLGELIHLIPSVLKPKKVLVIGPAGGIYEEASAACGADTSQITAGEDAGFVPEIHTIEKNLEGVDLLFMANPNRVTGKLVNKNLLHGILGISEAGGLTIVIDECLIEFTGHEGLFGRCAGLRRIIVMRTTAYFHGLAGLELAYAAAEPSIAERLARGIRGDINVLSSEAARTALKDKTYINAAVSHTNKEKNFLAESLAKIKGVRLYNSDSNFLLLKIDRPEEELTRVMKNEGFAVRSRQEIGRPGEFFCLSVMEHDKNKKFVRVMRDLMAAPRQ